MYHFLKSNKPSRNPEGYKGLRRVLFEAFFMTMPMHKWMITADARHYYNYLKQSEWLSAEK